MSVEYRSSGTGICKSSYLFFLILCSCYAATSPVTLLRRPLSRPGASLTHLNPFHPHMNFISCKAPPWWLLYVKPLDCKPIRCFFLICQLFCSQQKVYKITVLHFCNCKWLLLVTVMYQLHPLVWNVHLFSWLLGFINDAKIWITWQIRMLRLQAINSERFQRKSVTKWHERLTVLQLWFCPSQIAVMHFLALCHRQTFKCMV